MFEQTKIAIGIATTGYEWQIKRHKVRAKHLIVSGDYLLPLQQASGKIGYSIYKKRVDRGISIFKYTQTSIPIFMFLVS